MAQNRKLEDLLKELSPQVQAAFLESIQNMRSETQIKLLEEAIAARDVERALRLLNIEPAFFAPLDRALREAYEAGGAFAMADFASMARGQGVRLIARFDANAPDARDFVFRQSSQLVVDISEGQREALRGVLARAFDDRKSPRRVARDIVGSVNRATNRREGGILGLTNSEIASADRAFEQLRSGVPSELAKYRARKPRNKSFDRLVDIAIRDKKPIPADIARKIIGKMKDNMLLVRGERIARTELFPGLNHANNQALEQLIAEGKVNREAVLNEWDASSDDDTRDSHRAMDGDIRVQGEAYTSGDGNLFRFPGDRMFSPPPEDIINCRCRLIRRIDFLSELGPGD